MSQDEWAIEVRCPEAAVFAHFVTSQVGKAVEAKIVFLGLDLRDQTALKFFKLGAVDLAFKNGFLYPLTDTFAQLGNTAQAATAFAGFGVDVVADDDQHQRTR